jgi:hypothetical protein
MPKAYAAQNPCGYSLSSPVGKEVTRPFITDGFHDKCETPVREQILLLLHKRPI